MSPFSFLKKSKKDKITYDAPKYGNVAMPGPPLDAAQGNYAYDFAPDSKESQAWNSMIATLPPQTQEAEDALQILASYDTVLVVDDSGSMSGKRWNEARVALAHFTDRVIRYDSNGIDMYFINSEKKCEGVHDPRMVLKIFDDVKPGGGTYLGARLDRVLAEYRQKFKQNPYIKPVNIMVITDGEASDDVAGPIVNFARYLDQEMAPLSQVGIQFVQIGNDVAATAYLASLDDGLQHTQGIRDIVDCTPFAGHDLDAATLQKALLGGINKRQDGMMKR